MYGDGLYPINAPWIWLNLPHVAEGIHVIACVSQSARIDREAVSWIEPQKTQSLWPH